MAHDKKEKPSPAAKTLSADAVVAYLAAHPDFFVQHPELMAKLVPPTEKMGEGIVDFQHFMVRRLQQDNERQVEEKQALLYVARNNLNHQTRIHAAILALLETQSFEQLINAITTDLAVYLDVDVAALVIESRDPDLLTVAQGAIRLAEPGQIDAWLEGKDVLLLAHVEGDEDIYGPGAGLVRSEALLRLSVSTHTPVGMLAFGSRTAGTFEDGQGTELIGFLARVIERLIRGWLELAE